MECLEVIGPGNSDCRTMVAVAPCNVIFVIDFCNARVIAVHPFADLRNVTVEFEGFRVQLPIDAVLGKAHMKGHPDICVIHTENSGVSAVERHYGRVEYAV